MRSTARAMRRWPQPAPERPGQRNRERQQPREGPVIEPGRPVAELVDGGAAEAAVAPEPQRDVVGRAVKEPVRPHDGQSRSEDESESEPRRRFCQGPCSARQRDLRDQAPAEHEDPRHGGIDRGDHEALGQIDECEDDAHERGNALDTEESRDECVREVRIHETTLRREIHADDPRLLALAKRRVQPSAVVESRLTRGGTWGARVGAEGGCSSSRAGT